MNWVWLYIETWSKFINKKDVLIVTVKLVFALF